MKTIPYISKRTFVKKKKQHQKKPYTYNSHNINDRLPIDWLNLKSDDVIEVLDLFNQPFIWNLKSNLWWEVEEEKENGWLNMVRIFMAS